MDRGNSKHGPRVDEQMAAEARGIVQGAPDAGEAGGSPTGMTPDEREERSRLGRYLRRSVCPADRAALVDEARENDAPDDIVASLRRVPDGVTFQTVAEVWAAIVDVPEEELEQRF
jgi:hypothetical protein